jgi:retinol dehydrogenase-12
VAFILVAHFNLNTPVVFNVFFVRALADRLQSTTPLTPVAGNPGYCFSQLRRSFYELPFSLTHILLSIHERLLAWTSEQGSRQLVFAAVGGQDDEGKMRAAFVNRGRIGEVSDFVLSDEGHRMQDTIWVGVVH